MKQFFFVHIMKTAGTSFCAQATRHLRPDEIFPPQRVVTHYVRTMQYMSVGTFLSLPAETRDHIQFFVGHVPYVVAELTVPDALTVTVIREPVARTLSYLKQCQRDHSEHRGKSLEAIYDDPWYFPRFIENYQTKILSMTAEEAQRGPDDWLVRELSGTEHPDLQVLRGDQEFLAAYQARLEDGVGKTLYRAVDRAPTEAVTVDDARMATALERLDQVDCLGVTEHLGDLIEFMAQRHGWSSDEADKLNVTAEQPISQSFRARILADNRADLALYEHARTARSRARPIGTPTSSAAGK